VLGGGVTPRGEDRLVRLSAWMAFESAREVWEEVLGRRVSKATAGRAPLATGQAARAVWEAEVQRLKHEVPQGPAGAEQQALSGEGALGPRVGGAWTQVKTRALGELTRNARGEVCTQQRSSCSRVCDAASFADATLVDTSGRGLEQASEGCAVPEGAEWLPGLTDSPRAAAVRLLDCAPAAESLHESGQAGQADACPRAGWRACCLSSSSREQHECSGSWPGWPRALPGHAERSTCPPCRSGKRRCTPRPPRKRAGPWIQGAWKAPRSWWVQHASQGLACAGIGRTSSPCWCCAMPSAIASGSRLGRQRWRIGKHGALTVGKHRANSDWTVPCGCLSPVAYGCIDCPIPRVLLPPRRLRCSKSTQRRVLVLAMPGAPPFSGVLLPLLVLEQSCVQNN
jgi:hypothetical protein